MTNTTTPTTTTTSKTGPHTPPYPPIQPMSHPPPFIMFPFCANATPVASRGTVPTAIASKVFMNSPKRNDETSEPLRRMKRKSERSSRRLGNPHTASPTPQAPSPGAAPFRAHQISFGIGTDPQNLGGHTVNVCAPSHAAGSQRPLKHLGEVTSSPSAFESADLRRFADFRLGVSQPVKEFRRSMCDTGNNRLDYRYGS